LSVQGTGDVMDAYTAPKEKEEAAEAAPAPAASGEKPPALTSRPSVASHPIVRTRFLDALCKQFLRRQSIASSSNPFCTELGTSAALAQPLQWTVP